MRSRSCSIKQDARQIRASRSESRHGRGNDHRTVSADGTEIAARVYGSGPPLVLLPAGPGDSETSWQFVLPHLREHFTCYLMNTRGRGLSAPSADHSPARLIEDIDAFVDSIGRPVGLVEWASFIGSALALVVAQQTTSVAAVTTYEPIVLELATEEDSSRADALLARIGELVNDGKAAEAAQTFVKTWNAYGFYTDEDMADDATFNFWSKSAERVPTFLEEMQQAHETQPLSFASPSELAKTKVPVLLLTGARTHALHHDSVRYVADHVSAPTVREIPGAGHFGPHNQAAAVADELVRFFSATLV
jgi:pimeloyl-ACP methyl ester carboxylesterase